MVVWISLFLFSGSTGSSASWKTDLPEIKKISPTWPKDPAEKIKTPTLDITEDKDTSTKPSAISRGEPKDPKTESFISIIKEFIKDVRNEYDKVIIFQLKIIKTIYNDEGTSGVIDHLLLKKLIDIEINMKNKIWLVICFITFIILTLLGKKVLGISMPASYPWHLSLFLYLFVLFPLYIVIKFLKTKIFSLICLIFEKPIHNVLTKIDIKYDTRFIYYKEKIISNLKIFRSYLISKFVGIFKKIKKNLKDS